MENLRQQILELEEYVMNPENRKDVEKYGLMVARLSHFKFLYINGYGQ